MLEIDVFTARRFADPQGLIEDLIKQTSAQGKEIFDSHNEIERLKTLLTANNIPVESTPPKKKRERKCKTVKETPLAPWE